MYLAYTSNVILPCDTWYLLGVRQRQVMYLAYTINVILLCDTWYLLGVRQRQVMYLAYTINVILPCDTWYLLGVRQRQVMYLVCFPTMPYCKRFERTKINSGRYMLRLPIRTALSFYFLIHKDFCLFQAAINYISLIV